MASEYLWNSSTLSVYWTEIRDNINEGLTYLQNTRVKSII
jgi:hypothetical protein